MLTYVLGPLAINLVTEADQAAVSVMSKWAGKCLEQTLIQSRCSAAQQHTYGLEIHSDHRRELGFQFLLHILTCSTEMRSSRVL